MKIRRIKADDDVSAFLCESPSLQDYLIKYAFRNDQMRIARCMIAILDNEIIGYYTSNNTSIEKDGFSKKDARGLPGYPVPCLELGKLAVHKEHSGKGVGSKLLRDLFKKIVKNTSNPDAVGAFRFVIVDTAEGAEGASDFYQKYGFKKFEDSKTKLYLPVKKIIKAVGNP